jgi:hypothetical protein
MSGDIDPGQGEPQPELQRAVATPESRSETAGLGPSTPSGRPAPYYSPPPSVEPSNRPDSAASKPSARWAAVGIGIVLAAALAWCGWHALHRGPLPASFSQTAVEATAEGPLVLAVADQDAQATEWLKAILSGGSPSAIRAANAEAIAALVKNSPQTADEVRSGKLALYRLHLLDSLAQDGDEVEMFVNGVSCGRVSLSNAGTEIVLPLAAGAQAELKVVATRDGGGGVTFGALSSQGEARTQIMQVGEFDQWQVTVR